MLWTFMLVTNLLKKKIANQKYDDAIIFEKQEE